MQDSPMHDEINKQLKGRNRIGYPTNLPRSIFTEDAETVKPFEGYDTYLDHRLDHLVSAVSRLEDLVSAVAFRLDPVLRPYTEVDQSDGGTAEKRAQSRIATRVQAIEELVMSISERLVDVQNRLEL